MRLTGRMRSGWFRLLTAAAAIPLLQTAGCVDIAIRSGINGFFGGLTRFLQDALFSA